MLLAIRRFCLVLLGMSLLACGGDGAGDNKSVDGKQGEEIRTFTTGMQSQPGFVPFYHDPNKGKVYLLLHEGNRELLYQGSLPRGIGSNDIGLDRGQLSDNAALVVFEPAGDKVLMRQRNQRYRADSDSPAERASVEEAFASSVIWGFPVVARDGDVRLVDATEFLLRDSHGVGRRLKALDEGSFRTEASRSAFYPPRSKAFPRNTELEATVTLVGDNPGPQLRSVAPDPHSITVHMHHSFIALPEAGFTPRVFHPESGYFPVTFADYAAAIDEPLQKRWIRRHRLQPSAAGASGEKGAGEEIVYYVDPGVPEPVRSALVEGASWWSDAFAAAGFDNAFRVDILPEEADPMDVRYNVIQWVHRSTRGWSYGSSVFDPRTGEIIKGHVTLGSLRVRQDLLIARGMTAPFDTADDGDAPDDALAMEMALARIRQLSAHEVGHTLGLAHNFAASTRDRASVMDYPHPQMRLDNAGRISLDDAYATGIGEWDKRAIRYGYEVFSATQTGADKPDALAQVEEEGLAALLADNRRAGFEFISDPDSRSLRDLHPRSHLWDNGADPIAELDRVMTLRDYALSRFGTGVIPAGAALSDLQEAIVPVYLFHRYQVEAVGKILGGVDYSYAMKSESGSGQGAAVPVAPPVQSAALQALIATLQPERLALPAALLQTVPPKAYGYRRTRESAPARTGAMFDPLTLAEASAGHSLKVLLHPERLARIALQHAVNPVQMSLDQYFQALQDALLLPEYAGLPAAIDRRSTGLLLRHWRALYSTESGAPEVRAAAQAALERAAKMMRARVRSSGEYRDFYRFEIGFIERVLAGEAAVMESDAAEVPPGSPIGSRH